VGETQEAFMSDDEEEAQAIVRRMELPQGEAGRGRLQTRLHVSGTVTRFTRIEDCD
jgi:hypothetical protein